MGGEKTFTFNMSVGYDLKGIKTDPMQTFINNMIDSSNNESSSWLEQYRELAEWLQSPEFLTTFNCAGPR